MYAVLTVLKGDHPVNGRIYGPWRSREEAIAFCNGFKMALDEDEEWDIHPIPFTEGA